MEMAGTVKQVVVLRTDLGLSVGKMAAQACHASVSALLMAEHDEIRAWLEYGQTKIVLEAASEELLRRLAEQCEEEGLPFQLIADAGRTEVEAGTVTALGVGPAEGQKIDRVTGKLGLLR
jgi:PTH2 family peptidyl-tRNA hydrolase